MINRAIYFRMDVGLTQTTKLYKNEEEKKCKKNVCLQTGGKIVNKKC